MGGHSREIYPDMSPKSTISSQEKGDGHTAGTSTNEEEIFSSEGISEGGKNREKNNKESREK